MKVTYFTWPQVCLTTHKSPTRVVILSLTPNFLENSLINLFSGYAPDDKLQQAKADAIGDECQDIVSKYLWQYFLETDPERKVFKQLLSIIKYNQYGRGTIAKTVPLTMIVKCIFFKYMGHG